MIRLHKEDRELLVRIDLDAAPSAIEKVWATYEKLQLIAQRHPMPEALDVMKAAHGAALLLVTQLLVDTCADKAADLTDSVDNPDTEATGVVH